MLQTSSCWWWRAGRSGSVCRTTCSSVRRRPRRLNCRPRLRGAAAASGDPTSSSPATQQTSNPATHQPAHHPPIHPRPGPLSPSHQLCCLLPGDNSWRYRPVAANRSQHANLSPRLTQQKHYSILHMMGVVPVVLILITTAL